MSATVRVAQPAQDHGGFISISVEVLWGLKGPAPFDVYIFRAAEKYTKLFPKGEELDPTRLKFYRDQKDVHSLFVTKDDFENYMSVVEKVATTVFDINKNNTAEEVSKFLTEMVKSVTIEVTAKTEISPAQIRSAEVAVNGCIELLSKNPKKVADILRTLVGQPYGIRHALSTSLVALILGDAAGFKSAHSKEIIGMGAMLHDVGMSRLTFNPEIEGDLTAEQWQQVKEHPQVGKRMVDTLPNVPREVFTIILEHHEQPNGMGYPNGMHGPAIYIPSKIVSIADSFTALISARPYRKLPVAARNALNTMKDDRGKFDEELLRVFERVIFPDKK